MLVTGVVERTLRKRVQLEPWDAEQEKRLRPFAYVWDDEGAHEFFEVKAPKPNSDQTKVSKKKMLKLSAMLGTTCAYYALPYNPFPSKEAYGHSPPKRWFNMSSDGVVLIGPEFWDKVGGTGTWDDLMDLLEEVGEALRERIRREYLGLD